MNIQTYTFDIAAYLSAKATELANYYIANGTSGYFDRDGGDLADTCWFRLTRLDPVIRSMNPFVQSFCYRYFLELFGEAYYASNGIPAFGGTK